MRERTRYRGKDGCTLEPFKHRPSSGASRTGQNCNAGKVDEVDKVRKLVMAISSRMVCKKLSSRGSEFFFLMSQVNDILKVTLNLQSPSPVLVMRVRYLSDIL